MQTKGLDRLGIRLEIGIKERLPHKMVKFPGFDTGFSGGERTLCDIMSVAWTLCCYAQF